jgi:flavorubredoxin
MLFPISLNLPSTSLFEGIWPIPHGASINGYMVKGEKIALIDSTENYADMCQNYQDNLDSVLPAGSAIDYLIVNHMEMDHSGYIKGLVEHNPHIKIYTNTKTVGLLKNFYGIDEEQIVVVKQGDTLSLGGDKELLFIEAPHVHWPETMMTYEKQSAILFSCDAFGGFGATGEGKPNIDDECTVEQLTHYELQAMQYYTNIVASFSSYVLKAINNLTTANLPIAMIAPSHGLVWRGNAKRIVQLYSRWANYATSGGERAITLLWGSMYGFTEQAVDFIRTLLQQKGIKFYEHRVPQEDIGLILPNVWQSRGLILAMPSYEYKMFPPMAHAIDMLKRKHVVNKKVLRLGSFGWVGGAEREFVELTANAKWDIAKSIDWPGAPSPETLEGLKEAVLKLIALLEEN